MTSNLIQEISTATDLEQLIKITNRVVGEICWKASLNYGDELNLHIGAKIPYPQKSMAGKEKGAWILGTRATAWRLESGNEIIVSSSDQPEIIKQKVHVIENNSITAFETSYPDLTVAVTFSNECKLTLFPDSNDFDLPYWELFTPDGMLLKVGPGARWSYTSST
jgi:hypothetical protein